jgi:hypothetical protein
VIALRIATPGEHLERRHPEPWAIIAIPDLIGQDADESPTQGLQTGKRTPAFALAIVRRGL